MVKEKKNVKKLQMTEGKNKIIQYLLQEFIRMTGYLKKKPIRL